MAARHDSTFRYLKSSEKQLEAKLGTPNLAESLEFWRTHALEQPADAASFCRRTLEQALRALITERTPFSVDAMRLVDMVGIAEDEELITHNTFLKANEIRRLGNNGAHHPASVSLYDVQSCMNLLDEVLHELLIGWNLISSDDAPAVPKIALSFTRGIEDVDELSHKARTATLLSGDDSAEETVAKAIADAKQSESETQEVIGLAFQLTDRLAALADPTPETTEACLNALQATDDKLGTLRENAKAASQKLDAANKEVREILNEHDYIRKLLSGRGSATDAQFDVMAFPRTAQSSTNILQIAGGAGTGKTLCLIAKLIKDVKGDGQLNLLDERQRRGLFVCFNRNLAAHVRDLIRKLPGVSSLIDVESYDEYVNQFVRSSPKPAYAHLARFANDVRFRASSPYPIGKSGYMSLAYDKDCRPCVEFAMTDVATRHPSLAKEYYLDASIPANVDWVFEEITWLESRYEDERDANPGYLTAPRAGRGTSRLPNKNIRRVILEIWGRFRDLLLSDNKYTIEQATKRLLKSSSLPKYDSIAIDEIQDFSLQSIRLIVKMRSTDKSRVYLSGDENQKIYQRDFTWKELQADLRGFTITLKENKRNSEPIEAFANRLIEKNPVRLERYEKVWLFSGGEKKARRITEELTEKFPDESTALIAARSKERYFDFPSSREFRFVSNLTAKGLEFDNVIVLYENPACEDYEQEKRLRYVHFTRARNRLYIVYPEYSVPPLLQEYYSDLL